ncbi:MAG: hypothetical protein AMXMBFR84_32960 [Candidatus Hydrogenedentota bacterium]
MPTHTTTLGTPCARSWTPEWIAIVEAKEKQLNHRICGARTPAPSSDSSSVVLTKEEASAKEGSSSVASAKEEATPCTNPSNHPSGRCPHHGGFNQTGAPKGNRNHTIHGLYSRRLKTCTTTCPHHQTCPHAAVSSSVVLTKEEASAKEGPIWSPDSSSVVLTKEEASAKEGLSSVASAKEDPSRMSLQSFPSPSPLQPAAYSLQPGEAPCPYQRLEYNTVLTDALAVVETQPHPNPMGLHTAHNVAMLQVLANAAATTVANAATPWSPDTPAMITAYVRLMRELRASLRTLHAPAHTPLNRQKHTPAPPTPEGILRHAHRMQHDTSLDPATLQALQLPPQSPQTHAKAYIQQAIQAAGQGRDIEMCQAFDNATLLDQPYAQSHRDHILACYRANKKSTRPAPSLTRSDEKRTPNQTPPTQDPLSEILTTYEQAIKDGKVQPEAFPRGVGLPAQGTGFTPESQCNDQAQQPTTSGAIKPDEFSVETKTDSKQGQSIQERLEIASTRRPHAIHSQSESKSQMEDDRE